MLVKDKGFNNCTSWIFEFIYRTGAVQRPHIPLNSISQSWLRRCNCMTQQVRIYLSVLVMVWQWSMGMAQLSLMKRYNSSLVPSAPICCKSYRNHLLPTNTMSMDPLRHKSLLFLSTFYPITGNALTRLNLKCLRWVKILGSVWRIKPKRVAEEISSTTVQIRKTGLKCPSEMFLPLLLILKHSTHQVLVHPLQLENQPSFSWENKIRYKTVCTCLRDKHQTTVNGNKSPLLCMFSRSIHS